MHPGGELRQLTEDNLEVLQPCVIVTQPATTDRRSSLALLTGFGIGQVDQAVLIEVRRQSHVEQTTLGAGEDLRHASKRLGEAAVQADHTQAARPFGHQHALAVRQEGQCPGVFKAAGDLLDRYRPSLAGMTFSFGDSLQRSGDGKTTERGANGMAQHGLPLR